MEPASFRTVGGVFATTRVVRQPGASGTRRQPCRSFRASYRAPASSTSVQHARRASSDNSNAAIAEPFVGVWDPEDYVHIVTSRWLWLTSCRRSLHRNDDGVCMPTTSATGRDRRSPTRPETGRGHASLWTAAAAPDHRLWTTLRGPLDPSRLPTCPLPTTTAACLQVPINHTHRKERRPNDLRHSPESPRRHG